MGQRKESPSREARNTGLPQMYSDSARPQQEDSWASRGIAAPQMGLKREK